jgi:hypothetical protein
MKPIIRYSGLIVLLAGELFLIVPFLRNSRQNVSLLAGAILVVIGFFLFIVLNKK